MYTSDMKLLSSSDPYMGVTIMGGSASCDEMGYEARSLLNVIASRRRAVFNVQSLALCQTTQASLGHPQSGPTSVVSRLSGCWLKKLAWA